MKQENKKKVVYYSVNQVAEILNCGTSIAYDLIHIGSLPYVRIGKKIIRVKSDDLVRYLGESDKS